MSQFFAQFESFLREFGNGRKMVLSTSADNVVSSRMMSVIQMDGVFYFQTDMTFRKYTQLLRNPHVALCIDNIQIEGQCREIGHPLQNAGFCALFEACFKSSYDAYTALQNERLFSVTPRSVERWTYISDVPHMEFFDMAARTYRITPYHGV